MFGNSLEHDCSPLTETHAQNLVTKVVPGQGWRTCVTRNSLLSQFFSFFWPDQLLYFLWLRSDCIWITVAIKQHCERNIFTHIGSGANCWLDIYHWGAGSVVTGRIRDIGQRSFQTGSSSNPSYCHIFFLMAFLEETFIRNIILLLYINYIIIICINN